MTDIPEPINDCERAIVSCLENALENGDFTLNYTDDDLVSDLMAFTDLDDSFTEEQILEAVRKYKPVFDKLANEYNPRG